MQALTLDDNGTRYSDKPPEKKGKLIVIPSSSNMHLLPLFYLIPQELFIRHEEYIRIPRNLKAVIDSPEELERIDSDAFKELVESVLSYCSRNTVGLKPDFINLQMIYDLPDDKEMGWYSLGEFFI